MIILLSPAKSLDFENSFPEVEATQPRFVDDSLKIIKKLRSLSRKKISSMMGLSKELTELNYMRYHEWDTQFDKATSVPAMMAFSGEVYRGLNARGFTPKQVQFASNHLRILSGLHGVLRGSDLIRPYRLEMGTSLPVGRKKNLYAIWKEKVVGALNKDAETMENQVVINLASSEYFKAVDFDAFKGRVITPVFKDEKNGQYKVIMTWAKNARGKMARFIIENNITNPEHIKGFEDYAFNEAMSTETEWVFIR